MKRLSPFLAVAFLSSFVNLSLCTPGQAETINLAENWYVRITNFTLTVYSGQGFYEPNTYKSSTTSLIEPKLQQPGNPDWYNTLYFDFHAGQAQTSDYASFWPYATLGSEWSATMSFQWEINCSDSRLRLAVGSSYPGWDKVWWSAPDGTGYRTGTASFMTSTWGPPGGPLPPGIGVSFAPVPEPTSFVSLLLGLAGLPVIIRRRR